MRALRLLFLLLGILMLAACIQSGQFGYPAPEPHQDRGPDGGGGGM